MKKQKKSSIPSSVISNLEQRLYDYIMDNIDYDAYLEVSLTEEHNYVEYTISCSVHTMITTYAQPIDYYELRIAPKVSVSCDTFTFYSLDEDGEYKYYDDVAERLITEVIYRIK